MRLEGDAIPLSRVRERAGVRVPLLSDHLVHKHKVPGTFKEPGTYAALRRDFIPGRMPCLLRQRRDLVSTPT